MSTIAMLGAGAMGEALLAGLAGGDHDLIVVEPRADRAQEVAERHGGRTASATDAAAEADVVLVAVKPHQVASLLAEIAGSLREGTPVVSLAAGVTLGAVEAALSDGQPALRVMPNTPALVGEGMFAVSPGTHATEEHVAAARELLEVCGTVLVVAEGQQDAVTGLSGSGPAYVFYVVDALIEGGVLQGLSRDDATTLATQTVFGAATMLRETGERASLLREQVSSPAGTTITGLAELDRGGARAALVAAVEAATRRSRELGEG